MKELPLFTSPGFRRRLRRVLCLCVFVRIFGRKEFSVPVVGREHSAGRVIHAVLFQTFTRYDFDLHYMTSVYVVSQATSIHERVSDSSRARVIEVMKNAPVGMDA
jgi:hypothetical protein